MDVVDVAVALGALAEHDGPPFFAIDVARREEGERHHVEVDAVRFTQFARAGQFLDRPMTAGTGIGRIAADMLHAVPFEGLEHGGVGWTALAADVHAERSLRQARRGGEAILRFRLLAAGGGQGDSRGGQEFTAIHGRAFF